MNRLDKWIVRKAEKTIQKLIRKDAGWEIVLFSAVKFLRKEDRVLSPVFFEAMQYVTRKKYVHMDDEELLAHYASTEDMLAWLEAVRRGRGKDTL